MKVLKWILRVLIKVIKIPVALIYILTPLIRLGGIILLILFLFSGVFTQDNALSAKIYFGVLLAILVFSQQIMELVYNMLNKADYVLSPYAGYSRTMHNREDEYAVKIRNYLEIKNLLEKNK